MTFAPDLYLSPGARQRIERFIQEPTHALVLCGDSGLGLATVARAVATTIYPNGNQFFISSEDNKEISIDQIRALYAQTRSIHPDGLVVVIDDCDRMSIPAQNALLKLLEEPPANTLFILTSHMISMLLPTIVSRASMIELRRISAEESSALITSLALEPAHQTQIAFLAQGKPAEITRLAGDPDALAARAEIVRDARSMLEGSAYDRLCVINKYQTRDMALQLLDTLDTLSLFTLRRGERAQPKKYTAIAACIDNIYDNANVKLQLTKLCISL